MQHSSIDDQSLSTFFVALDCTHKLEYCLIISSMFNDILKYQHETWSIMIILEYDQIVSSTVLHVINHILEYYLFPPQALHLDSSAHANLGIL